MPARFGPGVVPFPPFRSGIGADHAAAGADHARPESRNRDCFGIGIDLSALTPRPPDVAPTRGAASLPREVHPGRRKRRGRVLDQFAEQPVLEQLNPFPNLTESTTTDPAP